MKANLPRKLLAILYADVADYSRLTGEDEDTTHRVVTEFLDIITAITQSHDGEVMHYAGDAVLARFDAVVNAVSAAVAIQNELNSRNQALPIDRKIQFRIGINLGDVIEDRGDIYGDGVNVAARLEGLANPGGICISDAVRSAIGKKLNLEYEDIGEQKVKNITEPVRSYRIVITGEGSVQSTKTRLAPELPDKPSIVVLPFVNMSGDSEQDYFSDGIVDGITTALSRIRTFFVIARSSAFVFKGQAVTFDKVREVLGVHYFLEGGVQKAGNRVRINVQLIETSTGAHVWAEKFDGELSDIFELQDKIIEQVAGALQPSIRSAEIARSRRKRPQDLGAYDYVMRALPFVWALDQAENQQALELLKEAINIDPEYPQALSLLAWCYGQQVNWSSNLDETREEALRLAKLAASLNREDPFVLTVLGAAYTMVNDHKSARVLLERAVSLDPNSAWAWSRLGWSKNFSGSPDEAIEHFNTALRLSPYDPMNFNCYFGIGEAYSTKGDFNQAIENFERGLDEHPRAIWVYRNLVPCYMAAGRTEDGQRGVQLLLQTYPELTATRVRDAMVFNEQKLNWIYDNLVLAGLPK